MYTRPTLYLDVETIPEDPAGPDEDALHPTKAVVVYVGLAHNDYPVTGFANPAGSRLGEDKLIWALWGYLCAAGFQQQRPLIVGHNIHRFDLPRLWLRARRARCPLAEWLPDTNQPPWRLVSVMCDTIYPVKAHQTELADFFGIPRTRDPGSGANVRQWWREGRLELIAEHCQSDVEVNRELHRHLALLPPTAPPAWEP